MINEIIDERKESNLVIRLEDSLKKIVKERARHDGRSVSNYIRKLLKEDVNNSNK